MTFLLKIRTAAMQCSNVDYRQALQLAADELAGRISILYGEPTEDNMRALQGAWACATRLVKEIPPEGSTDPLGGSCEPARLAA